MKHTIFICYRRSSSSSYLAHHLYDKLKEKFGADYVYMDVHSVHGGSDFHASIKNTLSKCRVLIVLMDEYFLNAIPGHHQPRLFNPQDFVRIELETAIKRGIRVIPVLTQNGRLPHEMELPYQLQSLTKRQAIHFRLDNIRGSTQRLIAATYQEFQDLAVVKNEEKDAWTKEDTDTLIGWFIFIALLIGGIVLFIRKCT